MSAPDRDEPDLDEMVRALFARQPSRMVPDLDRITTLTDLLGRPQDAYPSIHVTGTNGKTTTTRMIAALLGALGLTVGSYTSPHLQDVRERIRVAGRCVAPERLAGHLSYLDPFLAEVDARHADPVTFFEVLTAVAFIHFADAPVDVGVFEVGMGGRWDATNLVHGQVAVVLPVALDHPLLGSTPAEVAEEKAGIIKPDAIVVSGAQTPEVTAVLQRAVDAAGASLVTADRDFSVSDRVRAVGGQRCTVQGITGTVKDVMVPLFGAHQADNAACALVALEAFLGFAGGLDPEPIRAGFAAVSVPGRAEVVQRDGQATLVFDGGHNPSGVASLVATLADEFAFRRRVVVLAVLADKDLDGMLAALRPIADHVVATASTNPRAASADRVAAAAQSAGMAADLAPDVPTALARADELAGEGDGIVVTGSLSTVGEARTALGMEPA